MTQSKIISTLFILITLVFSSGNASAQNNGFPIEVGAVEAFSDGLVYPLMSKFNVPSGVVAIAQDGQLVFSKGYGYQDYDKAIPVDPETTMFRPGSVSKLFTWTSVMQLVEQGRIDLDADVNTYLKSFQIKDSYPGQPVTMRHMMTHSAGFEDSFLGHLIIRDPSRVMPLAESLKKYQPARVNPPGVHTAYSNYATALAGLIVENVSGMKFSDYVQKNIFDVLGMKHATFVEPLPENLKDNMAGTYAFEGGTFVEKPFEIVSNFSPAGASSVSAADMMIFGQTILNGGEYQGRRILKEETVRQMLARNPAYTDKMDGVALGFYELTENGVPIIGHHGATFHFMSQLAIDVKNRIVIFTSFGSKQGGQVSSEVVSGFYDTFYPEQTEMPHAPTDFAESAGKYAGTYLGWRMNFSGIEKIMTLLGGVNVAPTQDNRLLITAGGKSAQFVETSKNMFQELPGINKMSPGERKALFIETDGEITGLILGHHLMEYFKAPFIYTKAFNFGFLSLSGIVFLGVLLRLFYQRKSIKLLEPGAKKALRAACYASGANLLTVILGAIVLVIAGDNILAEIPLRLKLWLLLPILSTITGVYLLYWTVKVWKDGLCGTLWARIRFSIVTVCALFMCWFYYFWNILGFNYLS